MRTATRFANRAEAGRELAAALGEYKGRDDVVVLALPRGGVPVAFEVARELQAPLDVFVVRKLGLPAQPELAMGAIASGGVQVLNEEVVRALSVPQQTIDEVAAREQEELARRERVYRGERIRHAVEGKTVILIDDGVATGSTMRAAVKALRKQQPAEIVIAIPVAPPETCEALRKEADRVVCLRTPEPFLALGAWYASFTQTTDAEIQELLARVQEHGRRPATETPVAVPVDGLELEGTLTLPPGAMGVVLFAHGSGSSRHSPRNRLVASELHNAGIGTLLFDLLSADEERLDARTGELRFDIGLLARRVIAAVDWLGERETTSGLALGCFGASTGAAAALVGAAERAEAVRAVVSRGGRPDLAGDALSRVRAPTLLIVGGRDDVVLELNRRAQAQMHAETALEIVSGATHLFEEPGKLERVAELARDWFARRLG